MVHSIQTKTQIQKKTLRRYVSTFINESKIDQYIDSFVDGGGVKGT